MKKYFCSYVRKGIQRDNRCAPSAGERKELIETFNHVTYMMFEYYTMQASCFRQQRISDKELATYLCISERSARRRRTDLVNGGWIREQVLRENGQITNVNYYLGKEAVKQSNQETEA